MPERDYRYQLLAEPYQKIHLRPRFTVIALLMITDIASLLRVSRMTIFRRWQEYGLHNDPTLTLDDDQLRVLLSDLRRSQLDH